MSLQVCGCCGWSKITTYQGLRTHQGKMGCTPKGMRIPQSEQFMLNSGFPRVTYLGPPINITEPFVDIFSSPAKSDSGHNTWIDIWEPSQRESRMVNNTPAKKETKQTSDLSLQVCWCGWSQITTYQGLRIHQGKMGCTPKGMRIPESEQFRFTSSVPQLTFTEPPTSRPLLETSTPSTAFAKSEDRKKTQGNLPKESRQKETRATHITPVKTEPLKVSSVSPTFGVTANPAGTEVKVGATNQSLFETPTPPPQVSKPATEVRRVLDFYTGAQQVQQLDVNIPTTAAAEISVRQKETDRERERREQELAKAERDRLKADIQIKIQVREQKMAEVESSAKACKVSLDTEWLEINDVFSDVMRVVEEARQKALLPLEERRQRVKREAEDLVQDLQKEIDELKQSFYELDQNQDLQVSPLTSLDETWKTVEVDTSFSFGTLRATISDMMRNIQDILDNLSSIELKRTPKFAVDIKLDPTTAHPFLELSADGKKVRDGGKDQGFPFSPKRFDMFGSILGLNSLTSGRSYWEVEVRNKSGWDLGVARGDANRKGKLSLTPDNGYWVTVHYEDDKYAALATPPVSLALTEKPQKVGVFVDYEEGLVSFYDVMEKSHIYSFTECSFDGEIFPYFSPHPKKNQTNSAPLVISAVNKQE
ncbi:E3 ubiquitin-protein ligase TRIM21-like [Cheilinus undulatus]|uniref:E3 ubiquitin-protein ligase TRIM21-like n=1 Tax=Cheilinus undulatus TaxID=241271 RepID=UPI001BD51929|nr:E3 ubiquitin-protein ligase TRIM21-like [Cheilinus undulatus]XP_041635339.1 E3 ubiquitin-protein ligase TRIM21-like [Cheilinus undulatus]